ncbi:MAG: LysE family translocator [Gammaproteobacteria bacterium]|nr:LysE family translocator [Gammaproteobacteria bacterium]
MLAFSFAVFMLLITPGPGVLTTAGVGAAFGFQSGLRYVAGLCIGNNLVALAVISGLATVVFAVPWARVILLILSTMYLIYLAARIAFAGSNIAFIEARSCPGVRSGIMLQAINPKAYVVNTALFSGFAFLPQSLLTETAIKIVLFNLIWIPIHLLWLYGGGMVQQLNLAPRTQRRINLVMAALLLGVVALALTQVEPH